MIPAWLLALITLVVCSAIGVYYLNPDLYTGLVPEGFFVDNQSYTRKQAQKKCEADRISCVEAGGTPFACTSDYNTCTAKAVKANTDVSAVANAPSDPTQFGSSARASQTYAKNYRGGDSSYIGDLATNDKTWDNIYGIKKNAALLGLTEQNSDEYKKFLKSVKERAAIYDKDGKNRPTNMQLSLAQGDDTGSLGVGAEYKPNQPIIKAHMTPTQIKTIVAAKVNSDLNTQAQTIQENSVITPSIREMIRNDVKKAIREEIQAINNEYEVQYE
jgi:hypothetical protein